MELLTDVVIHITYGWSNNTDIFTAGSTMFVVCLIARLPHVLFLASNDSVVENFKIY
jgi:hypothetical protein